ncbi:hypothetical protein LXL04_008105 [Taraxacum kok-saghyz]
MVGVNSMNSNLRNDVVLVLSDATLVLRLSKRCRCILPYTCTNQTTLISYLVFFLRRFLLHYFSPTVPSPSYLQPPSPLYIRFYFLFLFIRQVSRFLFAPYLCSLFRPPLYSRFVVQLPSSGCNVFPFSSYLAFFFTLYIPFYCLASYLLSTFVSFSGLRYTPVLLYSFLPQDVMFFLFVFSKLHRSFAESICFSWYRFAKNETILYAFVYAYPLDQFMEKIDSQDMRREKHEAFGCFFFSAISLEDSPRIVGTNIIFFSQGDRFVPEDVNLFCFFFKASVFSRFCSTGLLLKPSGFLYTGLRNMKLYFMPFFTHILKLIRNSQDMRTESMKLWDVSFPGISLQDSPTIVRTNIVYFSQGEDFIRFVAEHETKILKGLLMVSVLARISNIDFYPTVGLIVFFI